jgi:hypothetical protein
MLAFESDAHFESFEGNIENYETVKTSELGRTRRIRSGSSTRSPAR